ncbi:MAG: hypothetical protein AABY09_04435, partial [Nanoarchaeota archaeon]
QTLAQYSTHAQPVARLGFFRLPQYFSSALLNGATVVVVPTVPVPPLSALGLTEFADFEHGNYGGITYNTMYFVRTDHLHLETTHYHELIHVLQWQRLGVDRFLQVYALGLLQYGYLNSPLEVMARRHQRRFESGEQPYGVEATVLSEIDDLMQSI